MSSRFEDGLEKQLLDMFAKDDVDEADPESVWSKLKQLLPSGYSQPQTPRGHTQ